MIRWGSAARSAPRRRRDALLSAVLPWTLVLPLVLLWTLTFVHEAVAGPLVKSYSRQDYDGPPQIFDVDQLSNGVLCFATTGGFFEFDGERFRRIDTPPHSLALAIDDDDRVWTGGASEIGYLEPSVDGRRYVSLVDQVPEENRQWSDVWPIMTTDRGVFFSAREVLLRYADERITAWPGTPEDVFYRSYDLSGRLFFAQSGPGLLELRGDALSPVPGGEIFANFEINAMFVLGEDRFLILTRLAGAYVLDERGIMPFDGPAVPLLNAAQVQQGIRLDADRLAIATRRSGVMIVDQQLGLLATINAEAGLADTSVHDLHLGRQGDLWVGTNDGISRLLLDSSVTFFGETSGLEGAVRGMTRHRGRLVVGTSLGTYVLGESGEFAAIPGLETAAWSFLSDDEVLLVGSTDGVFEVRMSDRGGVELVAVRRVDAEGAIMLFRSEHLPNHAFASFGNGLGLFEDDGDTWSYRGRVPDISREIRFAFDGDQGEIVAMAVAERTLYGIKPTLSTTADSKLGVEFEVKALPAKSTGFLMTLDDQGYYSSSEGLESYSGWQAFESGWPFEAAPLPAAVTANRQVVVVHKDNRGDYWLSEQGSAEIVEYRGERWVRRPLASLGIEGASDVFEDPQLQDVVWVGSLDGLYRLDRGAELPTHQSFAAMVRKVTVLDDGRWLYGGGPSPREPPELGYELNGLRFEFAAPSFGQQPEFHYETLLEGFDDTWQSVGAESFKEYTNLSEGTYTFRVRARDLRDEPSTEARFAFAIKPPWYRTLWAYVAYALAALLLILGAVRLRTHGLKRHNLLLEEQVDERTQELAQEKDHVERQKRDLESINALLAEENEHRRQLEAERAKLEARIEQSQKLESLGLMAGGIAHDFNNILMAILGNADLVLEQRGLQPEVEARLRDIFTASERAAELCSQMLTYAGKGHLRQEDVDISHLLRESLDMARASIGAKTDIDERLAHRLPAVRADATQLRQVLTNLLWNAIESMPESGGGSIRVETGRIVLDREKLQQMVLDDPLPVGPYVYVVIEDQGSGMDEDTRRKIFDPFFTTKFTGRGLGLAATLGILRSHKGAIRVFSQPGKGTKVEVFLPALAHTAAGSAGDSGSHRRWRRSGTILVVDDEEIVRSVAELMLRNTGFQVLLAASGAEAVALAHEHRDDLAGVLLDHQMPEMDGLETFDKLRAIDPRLPVILSSGYSRDDIAERYIEHGFAAFLHKPYKASVLRETLARVLDEQRNATVQ